MKPWLSILVPSISEEDYSNFIVSLLDSAVLDSDEFEIIKDTEPGLIKAFERCTARAKGEFVWIANDNLICESAGWDKAFKEAAHTFDDGIVMVYPNDTIFENSFACFPLLRKDIFEQLFPLPFEKYKIDDSVQDIFPEDRKIYLSNVVMKHKTGPITAGYFQTPNGSLYPIDEYIGRIDHYRYLQLKRKRQAIRENLCQQISSLIC